ncbi:MAG: hypothetical protein ACYTF6_06965, partial [Planctomycetota bacterium]
SGRRGLVVSSGPGQPPGVRRREAAVLEKIFFHPAGRMAGRKLVLHALRAGQGRFVKVFTAAGKALRL